MWEIRDQGLKIQLFPEVRTMPSQEYSLSVLLENVYEN